ncbi:MULTISPECIES: hypothetical protein [unclassified Sphingomonas]|uniref:hypothetical protein n=1 Tax=unclassified Sphingomonas TaxID=196159 RepID=UPI00226B4144|nr:MULTISPECIES: hypothetical protein [unclassified Sphingomonas]
MERGRSDHVHAAQQTDRRTTVWRAYRRSGPYRLAFTPAIVIPAILLASFLLDRVADIGALYDIIGA